MSDCIFCKIIAGDIPSTKVFENGTVIGFNDLSPMAAKHVLFIHKIHTENVNEISTNNPEQLTEIYSAINEFTNESDLASKGFRVVTNVGKEGGQSVFHTHFHVLGGEQLKGFGS